MISMEDDLGLFLCEIVKINPEMFEKSRELKTKTNQLIDLFDSDGIFYLIAYSDISKSKVEIPKDYYFDMSCEERVISEYEEFDDIPLNILIGGMTWVRWRI